MCFRPPSVDEGGESVCSSCGAPNPPGSDVCVSCGKPILKVPKAAMGSSGIPTPGGAGIPKPPGVPKVPMSPKEPPKP